MADGCSQGCSRTNYVLHIGQVSIEHREQQIQKLQVVALAHMQIQVMEMVEV